MVCKQSPKHNDVLCMKIYNIVTDGMITQKSLMMKEAT